MYISKTDYDLLKSYYLPSGMNQTYTLNKLNKFMENSKKQTAVEWLESEMLKPNLSMEKILQQAKEMEKQQIIDFANDLLAQNDRNYIGVPDLAEQYYNETFNK